MQFPFNPITLTPGNFADELKGLRFIQIADLLITTKTDPHYLHQLVLQINEHNVDLVFFTGDLIGTFCTRIKQQLHTLKNIDARSFFVSGNHDRFFGQKRLQQELFKVGITALDNACAHLIINNTPIQLVGLSERYGHFKSQHRPISELFSKLDETISTILISHQPKDVDEIKHHRIDIQLSAIPHNADAYPFHALLKKYQPYYNGLYVKGKTLLYVSRGLNKSIFKFKRHTEAEIPLFTIA